VLYWLFFCSGASGLIYQIVWVRAFGAVFGNTIHSAALVIAVFMLGLGVGSALAGRWADRQYAARRRSLVGAFGACELAIGGLALGVSALLPHLGDLSAAISSYERGADGWHTLSASSYVARAALAAALLMPITLLMGATLTLLIRHLVHEDVRGGSWRIALLYAANTAGAAVGCFLTDFALVPAIGIRDTQLVALALNLVAGAGALALATQVRLPAPAGVSGPGKPDPTSPRDLTNAERHPSVRGARLQPGTTNEKTPGARGVRLQPGTTNEKTPDVRGARLQPGTTNEKTPDVRGARLQPGTTNETTPGARGVRLQPDQGTAIDSALVTWTALAVALSGFAAMGMEIVWFRHFSMLLGEYRAVFSVLLTIILSGLGVGSLAGGWLARRTARPAEPWIAAQALFVVATLTGLTLVDARQLSDAAAAATGTTLDGWSRARAELWFNARPILLVTGLPALLMGVAFPLGNAVVQRAEARVGRRAGLLYLANTAGAVGGSIVAGFLLLPVSGLQGSTTMLVTVAALSIVPLHLATARVRLKPDPTEKVRGVRLPWPEQRRGQPDQELRDDRRSYVPATALATAGLALCAWLLLPDDYLISKGLLFPVEKAYSLSEGLTEVIAVTDGPNGGRVLVTNGHPMSSTELFSQRYMRAMAHIPLLAHDDPRRVLVLCYGVGNTAHAAALHPSVERIEVVDLSRHVLEHSTYFEEFNRGVLRDPRVAVYVNDGRHHLRMQPPGSYELITLEPPPIMHAGVAALYSREFYASARSRLAPKGFISQWLPVFDVSEQVVLSMARAFLDVFPNAVLLSGANMNLLLVAANDERTEVDPARVAAALGRAPAVQADLTRLDLGTLREIVGTFVAPAAALAAATRGVTPVTDDRPLQEYGKRSLVDFGEGGIPSSLIAVKEVAAWCPRCFSDGRPVAGIGGLDAYLALAELAYRTPRSGSDPRARLGGRTPAGQTRLIAGSGYLGSIVPDTPELPTLLAALDTPGSESADARYTKATALLEAGRFGDAIDELRAVIAMTPQAVEARNNLGVALASTGRLDEAIEQFRQALAIRPDFADAQRNLAMALQKRQ
jgi:spermidine synthase